MQMKLWNLCLKFLVRWIRFHLNFLQFVKLYWKHNSKQMNWEVKKKSQYYNRLLCGQTFCNQERRHKIFSSAQNSFLQMNIGLSQGVTPRTASTRPFRLTHFLLCALIRLRSIYIFYTWLGPWSLGTSALSTAHVLCSGHCRHSHEARKVSSFEVQMSKTSISN